MPKAKVFISYRRDDSAYVAHNIYDKLADHYGKDSVMFDVDAIPKGVDFGKYLNEQVAECDVLLAIIGDNWLDVRWIDGSRRLENPKDFVRIEIQAALKRKIPVIPVLVGKAAMPTAGQLPRGMKRLSRQNAAEVRAGRDLQSHLTRLVRDVDVCLEHVKNGVTAEPEDRVLKHQVEHETTRQPDRNSSQAIITKAIDMQLKLVEPNTFKMGSLEGESGRNNETQHEVTLTKGFYLGKYEVTQVEYENVIGKHASQFAGDDRRPVEMVTWFEAIEFCNRLSEQDGLSPYYRVDGREVTVRGGEGYRLPTEAEWEYACRAGSTTVFCFGDDESQLGDCAWYRKNSGNATHPVGEKQPPNDFGLYDMHGNVWEWCWDWYDDYPTTPQQNPTGPARGSYRVIRGGSWRLDARLCRSAFRNWLGPEFRGDDLGFRVARSSVKS